MMHNCIDDDPTPDETSNVLVLQTVATTQKVTWGHREEEEEGMVLSLSRIEDCGRGR
jgi:hypothetical protein